VPRAEAAGAAGAGQGDALRRRLGAPSVADTEPQWRGDGGGAQGVLEGRPIDAVRAEPRRRALA
jgi:hypothetical protein